MRNFLAKRSSGILFHISSVSSPYNIGDLGGGARAFVDFLQRSGQSWWQILPLGPTSSIFGNSPYMSCSAFAGNPLFISPELLLKQGLVAANDFPPIEPTEYLVNYDQALFQKKIILDKAGQKFFGATPAARDILAAFSQQQPWVNDHALFLALKDKFSNLPWYEWPAAYKNREPHALQHASKELARHIEQYRFEQYLFFTQWAELRRYANEKQIGIIGDLPIYVATDSVDVWAHQDIFQLDAQTHQPTHIAGVPPDYFSKTGQRWGNPLYRWHDKEGAIQKQLLDWWEKRLRTIFSLVDAVRIDHFRGFESYWRIAVEEKDAVKGEWVEGPGKPFFDEMRKRLGSLPIIAEDLGIITPAVEKLRDELGFPGMKILLFAFDGNPDNSYLPHNHQKNCLVYTGTHDNDTVLGWYLSPEVSPDAKREAKRYANRLNDDRSSIHHDFIHLALSSTAFLSIFPLQDILGFGNDCRMNIPSTTRGNWIWRCAPRFLTAQLADWLREQTAFFGRLPKF